MHAHTDLICFTPAALFTTTFYQLVQLSLTFAGTYLGLWLGLRLIGFLGALGDAVVERVRANSALNATTAEGDDKSMSPAP